MALPTIVQINLSPTLGGAEVYTASFSRALAARGWPTRVLVDAKAQFWSVLDFGDVVRVGVSDARDIQAQLGERDIVAIHAPVPAATLGALNAGRYVVALAHQAVYDGRRPAYYDRADVLLAVSRHVIATLQRHGIDRVHGEPLYAAGEIRRLHSAAVLRAGPMCEWDMHKFGDRLRAWAEPWWPAQSAAHARRPGLTLGIVSRLAPLKQFPVLFERLTPVLVRHPEVNIDIFGAAVGHRSLRDMRSALKPLAGRARFWGHQGDVASAYRAIDYLLIGLPEREALGLNVIESCLAGTPVLAIDAAPFTETMHEGRTGFLYRDPRLDQGADFERVLTGILAGDLKPDLAAAAGFLEQFSFPRFADRVDAAMHAIALRRPPGCV